MTISSQSHSVERTLDEWLSYLENIHSTEIDLGLTRIGKVAQRLAIDFSFAKVITVAGTNGKGTTCAFLENAFLLEGKSVAVYSSPHIERFNERLRLNKVDITDQPLIEAFSKIEAIREDISLTYYEYTTLAAFIVLMATKPDIIILEVGLGGRLDATNLIDADVAVITSVDLDHQAFLGDTREKIGFEKAGIMRADTLAIVGDPQPPKSVIDHANNIQANLLARDLHFSVEASNSVETLKKLWSWHYQQVQLSNLDMPAIPLDNVATALMVLQSLSVGLTTEKVNKIIAQTKVAGRTEVFQLVDGCQVMLDVGHNPHATRYLADLLRVALADNKYRKVHAVVSMLADKDIKNSLLAFDGLINDWYLAPLAVPRAAKVDELVNAIPNLEAKVNCFNNVTEGYKMAIKNAEATDLVLVFGSFFTVSEIRRLLVKE